MLPAAAVAAAEAPATWLKVFLFALYAAIPLAPNRLAAIIATAHHLAKLPAYTGL